MNVLKSLLLIGLVSVGASEAILSGNGGQSNQTAEPGKQSQVTDSFKRNETTDTSNSTFYYEANAFLLNKNEQKPTATSTNERESKSSAQEHVEPASIGSTSARNGRMLDLDALVGDLAASQSVKARSQTGNRQSRFLPTSGQMLEVGKGKRLHIQGFIPIVGVKDVMTGDESSGDSDQQQQDQPNQLPAQQVAPNKKSFEELPYAQSSIGHASFVSLAQQQQPPQPQSMGQIDAKFSGAGVVVDTLKKPLKKLMRYGETKQQYNLNGIQRQHAGCLCVPFYMCKNGFISESSLGGQQLQQLISSQQAAYLNSATMQAQPKAALTVLAPAPKAIPDSYSQSVPNQFATLSAQVDERSLDRDIITMGPMTSGADEQVAASSNQTSGSNETAEQSQASLAPNNSEGEAMNSTSELQNLSSDYSQEILGRMLGLKTLGGSKSSASSDSSAVPAGVCGLLRTCCNIPAHLLSGPNSGQHQDYLVASDLSNALAGQSQMMSFNGAFNRYTNTRPATNHQHDMMTMMRPTDQQQQQPTNSLQKYQMPTTNALLQRGTPYGFPSMQISRMQPLNSPDQLAMMSTALAHRSNMFPQSSLPTSNRFQAVMTASQPGDYKRAPQQMQYVPSMQQQSPPPLPQPMTTHQAMIPDQQAAANPARMTGGPLNSLYPSGQSASEGLGTRKILEGRCGLRQSAGINGRVQNLQYQENSADFGEYPAQTAILKRLSGTDSMFVCGGTLISQYWIATAAHCIKKHSISDLKVRLGEWDVHRDDEFYPYIEKGIRDLVVHSEFVPGNLVNDIALLRLDSPVDATLPHVNPACLPTIDESFTNQKCWVTGWGKDSFGQKGSFQTVLQEVELPVVGQAECESALRQTRLGPHYRLHSGFICAGGEGGKDACEGDGGSGLYCMQDGLIKVAGLVSWGIGCGQQGVPGVYVNLAHYRPWIENIISIDEDIYSRNSNSTSETDKTTTTNV